MVKTIEALFDGTVFHPAEPIALAPNTRVLVVKGTVTEVRVKGEPVKESA